jgi:hypothetical protein
LLTWHDASEGQHQRLGAVRQLLAALLGVLLALNLNAACHWPIAGFRALCERQCGDLLVAAPVGRRDE